MFEIINKTSIPKNLFLNNDISALLKNALENIGFIDLEIKEDFIEFKNNKKDTILESFQRRYGSGKLYYNIEDDFVVIMTKYSLKSTFIHNILIYFFLLVLFNIGYWLFKSNYKITVFYLIFSISFFIAPLINHLYNQWIISGKQKDLLKLLMKKIQIK